MTDLLTELRSITDALDLARVDYALCGGVALAIYGIPRATVDIDMLITANLGGFVLIAACSRRFLTSHHENRPM